jgi:hypothetical protein
MSSPPPKDAGEPEAEAPSPAVRKRPMIRVHGGELAKVATRVPSWLRNAHRAPERPAAEVPAETPPDDKKATG